MKINFIEYLRETVNKFPNKIAIDDNQATVSFSELDKITNNLTAAIISKINGHIQMCVRIGQTNFEPQRRTATIWLFIFIFKKVA